MKKIMCIALLLLLITVLVSCGSSSTNEVQPEQSSNQETHQSAASITPEEIYNDHDVIISTENIEYNTSDVSITFIIENNSETDYNISAHTYDVNYIMAGGNKVGSDVNVPSMKKARLTIDISNSDLEWFGIDNISEVGVLFWAYKDNFKEWDTGLIRFKTDMYDGTQMEISEPLFSDDAVSIAFFDNTAEDFMFIVENKTDYNVSCSFENCSINGWAYEITDYSYDAYEELINSKAIAPINLHIDQEFLDKNNIEEISEIEFDILLEDDNAELFEEAYTQKTEKITLSVEF